MTIAGMVKSSLVDFPGLVSCVLFTPGCNYNCFFCHNRQLIDGSHQIIADSEVMNFLKKRVGKLDGVVLTGGEPTLQTDLLTFMQEIRKLGYKVKLDTNGSSPRVIKEVLTSGCCDYFAVDYKAPAHRYGEICRGAADAETVLKTIQLLLEYNADFEVRTTVIPQLREDDLIQMAQELPQMPHYTLNRYRKPEIYLPNDEDKVNEQPFSSEQLHTLAGKIRAWQPNIYI
jgi:pyruvate formate lyase activating enzyme